MNTITVTKTIGKTEVNYKIITCGVKFPVPKGIPITVELNGRYYQAKMHATTAGRIDGLTAMYRENNIQIGDIVTLTYYPNMGKISLSIKNNGLSIVENQNQSYSNQGYSNQDYFNQNFPTQSVSGYMEQPSTEYIGGYSGQVVERVVLEEDSEIRARKLERKAVSYWNSQSTIKDLKQGISIFQEAMKFEWPVDTWGNMGSVKPTLQYRCACSIVAELLFKEGNYQEALKYCWYTCNIWEYTRWSETDWRMFLREERAKDDTCPESECFAVRLLIYKNQNSPFYDLQKAVVNAYEGADVRNEICIRFLVDYNAQFNDEQALETTSYYSGMLLEKDPSLHVTRNKAEQQLIEKWAKEVDDCLKTLNENWLPMVVNAENEWEDYSNLSEQEHKKLPRKSRNPGVVLLYHDVPHFKQMNYSAGVINLEQLWEYYKRCHSEEIVTGRIFKKKTYDYKGKIFEGDFVDCCKALWERKYFDFWWEQYSASLQDWNKDDIDDIDF